MPTIRVDTWSGNASSSCPNDPACIAEGEGKVVKVISRLLLSLPADHDYRVIFMQRPLAEVLASQDQMLRHRGSYKEGTNQAAIAAAFEKHLNEVYGWMDFEAEREGLPHSLPRCVEPSARDQPEDF